MVLDINAGVVYNSNPNPNETEPPLMRQVLRTVMALTCDASNISFGLPNRHGVNAAFLPMAIGAGMPRRS